MAEWDGEEFGKLRKMKARTGNLGDGPSSFPSFSPVWRGKGSVGRDGIIGGSGGGGDRAAAESDGGEQYEFPVEEGSWDPLVVFGSGIMMMILDKLDARSVALARLVSRGWLVLASSDKIWAPKEKRRLDALYTRLMEAFASVRGVMGGEGTHTTNIESAGTSEDGCLLALNHGWQTNSHN
ncbi:hypothetical protein ACS0TY_026633 [Phlomoides rotata]